MKKFFNFSGWVVSKGLLFITLISFSILTFSVHAAGDLVTLASEVGRQPVISGDGRYVVFVSYASNLVSNDTNNENDVFVRDLATGVTTRVSISSDGTQANNASYMPTISGDGRYVVFVSYASNLVSNDTNNDDDVFVRDLVTGVTTRVSVSSDGSQANGESLQPSISSDGRFIAFFSAASNLVPNDTNGRGDTFVHDTYTGITARVSIASDGTQANSGSGGTISADGRYVVFNSEASNLVPNDNNGTRDIFIHERSTGETTLVSIGVDGAQANNWSENPSISADGRYVLFMSKASNLVPNDSNDTMDFFVRDQNTGLTNRICLDPNCINEGIEFAIPNISVDGRYVLFDGSSAEYQGQIVLYDLKAESSQIISINSAGTRANGWSSSPSISDDGNFIVYYSEATNLTPESHSGIFVYVKENESEFIKHAYKDFVITVDTGSSASFTIPTLGEGYNYNVDCMNDGIFEKTSLVGNSTCSYSKSGKYSIRIRDNNGDGSGFPRIFFNNSTEARKLIAVDQWGTIKWKSFANAFYGAIHFEKLNTDFPNLENVSDMSYAFAGTTLTNPTFYGWNTQNVSNMDHMFDGKLIFERRINFNLENLLSADGMFENTYITRSVYDNFLDSLADSWYGDSPIISVQNGVIFSAGTANYCYQDNVRDTLIEEHNWVIEDGGEFCGPLIIDHGNNFPENNSLLSYSVSQLTYGVDVPLGAGTVYSLENYLLVYGGSDEVINTFSCADEISENDQQISIDQIEYYDEGPLQINIYVNGGAPLSNGVYRFFICGTGEHVLRDNYGYILNSGLNDHIVNFNVQKLAPISPSETTLDTTPSFSFEEIQSATRYRYEVFQGDTLKFYMKPFPTICADGICMDNPNRTLIPGDYKWRLAAQVNGVWSIYSNFQDFNVIEFNQIAPSGLITDSTPTFSWSDIGATQYHLRVMQGASEVYIETVSSSYCTTNCEYTPTTPLSLDTDYTWAVEAYVGSTWSGYGTANNIRVVALNPTGPTNVSLNGKPTLTWDEVSGASVYSYQILSGVSVVRSGTVGSSACVSDECSVAITSALGSGSFTWRFKATVNSATSDYSEAMALSVARATLTAPSGTITDKTPTYTFNHSDGASAYLLGVMQGEEGILYEEFSASSCSTTCSYTPTSELSNGSYVWFINAKLNGAWSEASDTKSFSVMALTPISPSGTTLDAKPPYAFSAVAGATRYQYQVYQGATLKYSTRPYPTICSGNTCTDTTGPTLAAGDYTWRYQAKVGGVWTVYSDFESFSVAALTPIAPKGTITNDTPTFTWSTVPGATNYELVVSGLDPVEVPATDCAANCTYTFADPFDGGSYTWKVRMYLDGAWTAYTSDQAFSLMKLSTISPSGTTLDAKPNYVFSAVAGATRYQYQVYQGATLKYSTRPYPTICSGNTCTDTTGPTLAAGDYTWRYQAKVGGVWTVYSDFESFTVAALTPIAPKGTITNDTPTFTWSTVPGAEKYELLVSGLDPVELAANTCSGNCSYTFADPFDGGSYTWKVRMYLDDAWTAYTSDQAFSLMKLSTISPSGTTLDSNPPYVFTAVAGATRYQYQVYQGNTLKFYVKPYPTICSGNTCTDTSGSALPAGDYRWRYQAKVGGVWTVFSDFEEFSIP